MSLITESLFVQIFVDGVELPLTNMPLIKLALYSRLRTHVPVGEVILSDPVNLNNRLLNLTDGTPITIRVGTSSERSSLYKFRVFKPKSVPSDSGSGVHLSLYYDAPLYWTGRTTKPFTGTSSQLVDYIAESCGLISDIDRTSDSQVWLPMNARWCEFASKTASAGYVNDKSCMQLGLRLDRVLAYKNVDALNFDTSEVHSFHTGLHGDPKYLLWPSLSHKLLSASGYANNSGGYALSQVSHSAVGADTVQKTVNKTRQNENMFVNTEMLGMVKDKGKAITAPVDAGNTHPFYQQATYQNLRSAALNSGRLELVTNQVTGADLLDPTSMRVTDLGSTTQQTTQMDKDASGNYYVGAKTVYVDIRAIYYERFTMFRDGHTTNLNPNSKDL